MFQQTGNVAADRVERHGSGLIQVPAIGDTSGQGWDNHGKTALWFRLEDKIVMKVFHVFSLDFYKISVNGIFFEFVSQ